jgi:hypothetical protein
MPQEGTRMSGFSGQAHMPFANHLPKEWRTIQEAKPGAAHREDFGFCSLCRHAWKSSLHGTVYGMSTHAMLSTRGSVGTARLMETSGWCWPQGMPIFSKMAQQIASFLG